MNGATDRRGDRGTGLAVFLVGLGAAWTVGNVGAVVSELGPEFEISLATVGLLSGTLLLGFSVPGTLLAPLIAERLTIVRTMTVAALLCAVGNVVFAVTPVFAGLVVGRAIAGFGLGLAVVAGPVFARATGGIGRVALFGAAIQLGIAGGLGVGAILSDLDVDWRLTFLLSAGVAVSPLPLLIGRTGPSYVRQAGGGFVKLALRSSRVWRLGALFIAVFSVPLILGSWLVHYLSVDNGLAAATAGALSFVMFGVSAAAREEGGRLAQRGVSPALLVGGAPFLAAAGLAILALDDSLGSRLSLCSLLESASRSRTGSGSCRRSASTQRADRARRASYAGGHNDPGTPGPSDRVVARRRLWRGGLPRPGCAGGPRGDPQPAAGRGLTRVRGHAGAGETRRRRAR